jgi:hypothetical protein
VTPRIQVLDRHGREIGDSHTENVLMTAIDNATVGLTPPPLAEGFAIGRRLNELRWSAEVAYLVGGEAETRLAIKLMRELAVDVRRIVADEARERLARQFQDAAETFAAVFASPYRGDAIADAESDAAAAEWATDEPQNLVRRDLCRRLLRAIDFVAPNLSHDVRSASACPALAKAVRLGEVVDQGLRPAESFRHMYRPTPAPVSVETVAAVRYPDAIPFAAAVAQGYFDAAPAPVLFSRVPGPGSVPLDSGWWKLVEQTFIEMREVVGPSLPAGVIDTAALGDGPEDGAEPGAAVERLITVVADRLRPTGDTSRPSGSGNAVAPASYRRGRKGKKVARISKIPNGWQHIDLAAETFSLTKSGLYKKVVEGKLSSQHVVGPDDDRERILVNISEVAEWVARAKRSARQPEAETDAEVEGKFRNVSRQPRGRRG